jgi:monofunctional biosynthetic peptidoglycan transglycosylase
MPERRLVDFADPALVRAWEIVNDGVMGGRSDSDLELTADGTALFRGVVSLANRGGFAMVRTRPDRFDLTGCGVIRLEVRGDGQRYRLRLRTDDDFDGVAYQAAFPTLIDAWTTAKLSLADFAPTFRGRPVPGAPPLDPARVRRIGIIIADGQAGPFRLEIARITAAPR